MCVYAFCYDRTVDRNEAERGGLGKGRKLGLKLRMPEVQMCICRNSAHEAISTDVLLNLNK